MTLIFSSIALFVTVSAFTVIALTIHNARQQDKLLKLNAQMRALTLLAHAQEYLTQFGIGNNLEYSNARAIVECAMYNVLYN